mmetsp:Transcript_34061/g.90762  ORF Transcript_34061/g.90762 Transcript_34061/m.90762 type:complete len:223 (-) Transcript_34061:655-1323(-)
MADPWVTKHRLVPKGRERGPQSVSQALEPSENLSPSRQTRWGVSSALEVSQHPPQRLGATPQRRALGRGVIRSHCLASVGSYFASRGRRQLAGTHRQCIPRVCQTSPRCRSCGCGSASLPRRTSHPCRQRRRRRIGSTNGCCAKSLQVLSAHEQQGLEAAMAHELLAQSTLPPRHIQGTVRRLRPYPQRNPQSLLPERSTVQLEASLCTQRQRHHLQELVRK